MLWILCSSMMITWSVPPPSPSTPRPMSPDNSDCPPLPAEPHPPATLRGGWHQSASERTSCQPRNILGTARHVWPYPRCHATILYLSVPSQISSHSYYSYFTTNTNTQTNSNTPSHLYTNTGFHTKLLLHQVLCYDVLAHSCQVHSVFYISIFVLKRDICAV